MKKKALLLIIVGCFFVNCANLWAQHSFSRSRFRHSPYHNRYGYNMHSNGFYKSNTYSSARMYSNPSLLLSRVGSNLNLWSFRGLLNLFSFHKSYQTNYTNTLSYHDVDTASATSYKTMDSTLEITIERIHQP